MKNLLLPVAFSFALGPLPAQSPPQPTQGLLVLPSGEKLFVWRGHIGRSYFLQTSLDLEEWHWAPVIEAGTETEISYEFGDTADKAFFRLVHTDQVPGLGETLDTADFDGDGISNLGEINPPAGFQTNPLNFDSDSDGLSDGWERAHGLDPNDDGSILFVNGAGGPFQGGPATNGEAYAQGVSADPAATLEDHDGDGLNASEDADDQDKAVFWKKAPESGYAVIELPTPPIAAAEVDHWDLGEGGHVMISKEEEWMPGSGHLPDAEQFKTHVWHLSSNAWSAALPLPDDIRAIGRVIDGMGNVHGEGYTGISGDPFYDFHTTTCQWDAQGGAWLEAKSDLETAPFRTDEPLYDLSGPSSYFLCQFGPAQRIISHHAEDASVDNKIQRIGGASPVEMLSYPSSSISQEAAAGEPKGWHAYSYKEFILSEVTSHIFASYLNGQITTLNAPDSQNFADDLACIDDDLTVEGRKTAVVWVEGSTLPQPATTRIGYRAGDTGELEWKTSTRPPAERIGGKVNARGEGIANRTWPEETAPAASLWRNGKWHKLTDLMPEGHGYTNILAIDSNDSGMILAKATESGVEKHVILLPVEVSWHAIAGFENVDDHMDPWGNTDIAGNRIFPGYRNPDDTEIRHKLELIVKTSPSLEGETVFVKAFDVDDSTSESFDVDEAGNPGVIDTNGNAGDDNMVDYLNIPKGGQFWTGSAWGDQTAEGTVDANGEAKFIFRVGMQPGSNYRVVASVMDETMYAGVQTSDPASPGYLGPETDHNGGALASPLLTVWRKLWVENDSMEAIPTDEFGYERNDLSWDLDPPVIRNVTYSSTSDSTSFGIDAITDQSSFLELQNGRIIVQSETHPVIATQSYNVTVSGNYGDVPVGSGFRLYDDDDKGLSAPPLPRNDLVNEQMKNYFRPSFVEIMDANDFHTDKEVPFRKNEDVSTNLYGMTSTVVADARELTDSPALWVAPLTAAYQGPQDADKDPSGTGEGLRQGETATYNGRDHSTVFVEACRETYDDRLRSQNPQTVTNNLGYLEKWIVAVAAHEIAHQPGVQTEEADHAENGLMVAGLNEVSNLAPENAKFTPSTVVRFRKSVRWSQ